MTDRPQMVKRAIARLRDENPDPRVLITLVVDDSGSTEGEKNGQMKAGIPVLAQDLCKDDQASQRVEIALITFGNEVKVEQNFTPPSEFKPPILKAKGPTPMAEAILKAFDLIDERQARFEANDIDSFIPWIFLITDGESTDSPEVLARAVQRIHEAEGREGIKRVNFFAVGVDGANMESLAKLSKRAPVKLRGLEFSKMFRWVSRNLIRVSQSRVGERVKLTNPEDWVVG